MHTKKMSRREQIVASLRDKTSRDAFIASLIRFNLPSQIKEMRERRGWSQVELGSRAQMAQTLVSRFESKGYEQFSLRTLRKLASAFDVGLQVGFVPFSDLADAAAYPERHPLDVPSFREDVRLIDETASQTVMPQLLGSGLLSGRMITTDESVSSPTFGPSMSYLYTWRSTDARS